MTSTGAMGNTWSYLDITALGSMFWLTRKVRLAFCRQTTSSLPGILPG